MSSTNPPFFTVIIPLYNKRAFILQAVQSVLTQRFDDFELLVIDDGSSDGSSDILEEMISDPRLRIIRQKNLGGAGSQARNSGMVEARGDWFAFLDADDIWFPNHLTELAAIIEHAGQPALISTRPIELPAGTIASPDLSNVSEIREVDYFREAGRQIGQNNCSSSAIHREVFGRLGGFAYHDAGEDLEYWARIALLYPFVLSSRITSIYYRGTGGVMETSATRTEHKFEQKIESLSDVSPSLAMLAKKAADRPELLTRSDIQAYINGRLYNGMLINIRQGSARKARALRKLMIGRVGVQAHLATAAAWLPESVLKFLMYFAPLLLRSARTFYRKHSWRG